MQFQVKKKIRQYKIFIYKKKRERKLKIMKKSILKNLLAIVMIMSMSLTLFSCENMTDEERRLYLEYMEKQDQDIEKALDKVRESKEDNRTETIIGGEEKALDKVRESKEEKEPETYSYTTNEKGERVYRVYDDYVGEEVDNPELYKDEYYIGESGKKNVPTYDTVVDKWDKYGAEVKAIVEKYEGKDYKTSKSITSEELKKLHSAGLYMYTNNVTSTRGADDITRQSGGSTDFVSKSEFENIVAQSYKDTNGLLTNIGFGGDAESEKIMKNTVKQILENKWEAREEEREQIARMYAKKNTDASSPAQYINSLGNGNYVVKCGLVVPSEENATYYESLRGQDKINYKYTEWMVFKQNNQGRITLVKDSIPRAKYKENTFGDLGEGNVGMMLWVSRTPNEERVTFFGKTQYAIVSKTFPEYYDKCAGTDMAFSSWADTPNPLPYDYTYNKVADGSFDKETQLKFLIDRENW